MSSTIDLGIGHYLFKDMDDATANCPGRDYELIKTPVGWYWQSLLENPFMALLNKVERLEERVYILERNV